MKRLIRLVATALPLLLALATGVFAQTQITAGVIQGTVLDEQGGVVPGANVEVKNPDTNFSRKLKKWRKDCRNFLETGGVKALR